MFKAMKGGDKDRKESLSMLFISTEKINLLIKGLILRRKKKIR